MLRRLFRGGRKKENNVDLVVIEGKAFGRKPEDQFRLVKMIDTGVGYGDAVTEIAITFTLIRLLRPEMTS